MGATDKRNLGDNTVHLAGAIPFVAAGKHGYSIPEPEPFWLPPDSLIPDVRKSLVDGDRDAGMPG